MDEALMKTQEVLDEIKKTEQELEYWSARDLMHVLGYKTWSNFEVAIRRAKDACAKSGYPVTDHFVGAGKKVSTGSGAVREINDILLTRFACYLVAQNGDPRKPQIAHAQTYFATQTRKQELLEQRDNELNRLDSRSKLKETEKIISSTIYERGIKTPVQFGTFKDFHIKALYGGISTSTLKRMRKIPSARALADFDTDVELKAKDFALAMTDHNIKQKNIKGSTQMNLEVIRNSKATRQTLLSRDIRPETLKPQEDLRIVERRRKKELGVGN